MLESEFAMILVMDGSHVIRLHINYIRGCLHSHGLQVLRNLILRHVLRLHNLRRLLRNHVHRLLLMNILRLDIGLGWDIGISRISWVGVIVSLIVGIVNRLIFHFG
jgi:hypothetical protein